MTRTPRHIVEVVRWAPDKRSAMAFVAGHGWRRFEPMDKGGRRIMHLCIDGAWTTEWEYMDDCPQFHKGARI